MSRRRSARDLLRRRQHADPHGLRGDRRRAGRGRACRPPGPTCSAPSGAHACGSTARSCRGASTEHPDTGRPVSRLRARELGVRDAATRAALAAWRRAYNLPLGLWTARSSRRPGGRARSPGPRAPHRRHLELQRHGGRILEHLGLAPPPGLRHRFREVGVEKPDPRIFRLALARAGVGRPQAAYVGDLYSIDVLGARAAGLRPVLLDPGGCWPALEIAPPPSARWRPSACCSTAAPGDVSPVARPRWARRDDGEAGAQSGRVTKG